MQPSRQKPTTPKKQVAPTLQPVSSIEAPTPRGELTITKPPIKAVWFNEAVTFKGQHKIQLCQNGIETIRFSQQLAGNTGIEITTSDGQRIFIPDSNIIQVFLND